MLHLIPALVLMFLHGPATLERAVLSERLPEVIAVFSESGKGDEPKPELGRAVSRYAALLALRTCGAEFSKVFADLLGLSEPVPTVVEPDTESPSAPIAAPPPSRLQFAFVESAPTRAGPIA